MTHTYKILNLVSIILFLLSLILLWINRYFANGILAWVNLIVYLFSLFIYFISWSLYKHLNTEYPFRMMRFYRDYYDKIGYGLFTGGVVALVTTDKIITASYLVLVGVVCAVISMTNKVRLERFEAQLKQSLR